MQMQITVEQCRQKIQFCLDHNDMTDVADVISSLEQSQVTKEILEMTRVGLAVNALRKRTQTESPDLSRRCRILIKDWQKLVERPSSGGSSSSHGGTPNVIHHNSVPKLYTVGSSDADDARPQCSSSSFYSSPPTVRTLGSSPNGPWSPAKKLTNTPRSKNNFVRLGLGQNELFSQDSSTVQTGGDTNMCTSSTLGRLSDSTKQPFLLSHLQMTTVNGNCSTTQSRSSDSSVASSRRLVMSTAKLVAQMSRDLPQHMAVDLKKHEHRVKEEQKVQEREDRRQIERVKEREQQLIQKEERKRERTLRRDERRQSEVVDNQHRTSDGPPAQRTRKTDLVRQFLATNTLGSPYDWYSTLPALSTPSPSSPPPTSLREHSHTIIVNSSISPRRLYILPYVDMGLPAFIEHQFPDHDRYIAEENFMFGRSWSSTDIQTFPFHRLHD